MESASDTYVTSRSRAPSIIEVTSEDDHVFSELPDCIQEAAVSVEFSGPNLRINRVHNSQMIDPQFLTQPMFYISSTNDSGVDMIDITVTDEKIIGKFGADLTANFADIRAYGADAFFQKKTTPTAPSSPSVPAQQATFGFMCPSNAWK